MGLVCLTSSRSSSGLLFSAGGFSLSPGFRYACVCLALAHFVFYVTENKCVTM